MTKKHQGNRKHKYGVGVGGGVGGLLNVESLLLLTLIRLRISAPQLDLGFRFKIS